MLILHFLASLTPLINSAEQSRAVPTFIETQTSGTRKVITKNRTYSRLLELAGFMSFSLQRTP